MCGLLGWRCWGREDEWGICDERVDAFGVDGCEVELRVLDVGC